MSRKWFVLMIVLGVLAIAISAAAAQGNGNGNDPGGGAGNGPNGPNNGPANGNGPNGPPWQDEDWQPNANRNRERWNAQQRACEGSFTCLPPAYEGDLPQRVIDLMIQGWTDEQVAVATYGALIEQFGAEPPFSNIQRAEQQHIAAWEFLFDRYDIAAPELPEVTAPQFASKAAACQAGADLEIANFGLYDTMLAAFEDYPDLHQVTLALRNASEFNHLPALERCAS